MNKSFSHLIWLGAGQAKEPMGLINQAKQVTLVDAREPACEYLKKQFPSDHVQVINKLITVHGGQQNFTEYNLPEYSALQVATGLKKLFPGLKITHQEKMDSVPVEPFFKGFNLTDNKNLLVVDLPDINQAFLEALHKTGYLYKFNKLYIVSNPAPLYLDASTASAIANFLQSVGYFLQETISADPDFPCLVFGINPLWMELQTLKEQLATQQQQMNEHNKEQEKLKQKLAEEQKKLTESNALLDQATKQSSSRKDTVTKLEKEKRALEEVNKTLMLKQNSLEKELIKAEAQIELIKMLLVKA